MDRCRPLTAEVAALPAGPLRHRDEPRRCHRQSFRRSRMPAGRLLVSLPSRRAGGDRSRPGGSCGARSTTNRSDARRPAPRGAGDPAAGGPGPHPAGRHGRDDRRRRRPRGAARVLGRVPPRRRVHAPAAVGAGQDGRRHHPRLRHAPASRGERAPRARSRTSPRPRPAPVTAPPNGSAARSTSR